MTKILLVDDSRATRAMVGRGLLQACRCAILEAANGRECLEAARHERPHLIVLDITMPVLDGVEALVQLKADPELRVIPVVMLTANANPEEISRVLALGAAAYVTKTQRPAVVVEEVVKILEAGSISQAIGGPE